MLHRHLSLPAEASVAHFPLSLSPVVKPQCRVVEPLLRCRLGLVSPCSFFLCCCDCLFLHSSLSVQADAWLRVPVSAWRGPCTYSCACRCVPLSVAKLCAGPAWTYTGFTHSRTHPLAERGPRRYRLRLFAGAADSPARPPPRRLRCDDKRETNAKQGRQARGGCWRRQEIPAWTAAHGRTACSVPACSCIPCTPFRRADDSANCYASRCVCAGLAVLLLPSMTRLSFFAVSLLPACPRFRFPTSLSRRCNEGSPRM